MSSNPTIPTLETPRLTLRPFVLEDATTVHQLLQSPEISDTTLNIPFPYELEMALEWIDTHKSTLESGEGFNWAIILKSGGVANASVDANASRAKALAEVAGVDKAITKAITEVPTEQSSTGEKVVGSIGLGLNTRHNSAEIGFWLGTEYWNRGLMTEAAAVVRDFAFQELGINRLFAGHFPRNPASGRVQKKIGMTFEGVLRQVYKKGDHYEDVEMYSILKSDLSAENSQA